MHKIGTDPEFFLFDTEKNKYISAHSMIPGDKKQPHKVDCGAIQVDGTAVEFNIDPVESYKDFEHNIQTVLDILRKEIPSRFEFRFVPIIQYDLSVFRKIPKESLELGCDPDFSAYTLKHNIVPKDIGRYRTGSGHIHIGWTDKADTSLESDHFQDCVIIARQMDAFFYPFNYMIDQRNRSRTAYYGANAAFRPKSYGCEYRGFSNFWLTDKKYWKFVYDATVLTFKKTLAGDKINQHYSGSVEGASIYYKDYGFKGI